MADTRQTFEYRVVTLKKNRKGQEDKINSAAAQGWLLVNVSGGMGYFKRSLGTYNRPA